MDNKELIEKLSVYELLEKIKNGQKKYVFEIQRRYEKLVTKRIEHIVYKAWGKYRQRSPGKHLIAEIKDKCFKKIEMKPDIFYAAINKNGGKFRKYIKFSKTKRFEWYFLKLVYNASKNFNRKYFVKIKTEIKLDHAGEDVADIEASSVSADAQDTENEHDRPSKDALMEKLKLGVKTLRRRSRTIMNLHYYNKKRLSRQEIATRLGIPLNTVKSQIRRSRKKLIEMYRKK